MTFFQTLNIKRPWFFAVLISAASLFGCGGNEKSISNSSEAAISSSASTSSPTGVTASPAISDGEPSVLAYYFGDGSDLARYDFNKLQQVIFSFALLDGNKLFIDTAEREKALKKLVALKNQYPNLKVTIAFGGWGGCETCSKVFSSAENRQAFADSSLALLQQYELDGLDLDWEYPAISGYPGHPYKSADRENFTALVIALRQTLGEEYLLSFAAGGNNQFIEKSIEWEKVTPYLNNINIMSYDLYNASFTGFHTALFSSKEQELSADNSVKQLLARGVPANKIVIGAAFYSRSWSNVSANNDGRYQRATATPGENYIVISREWNEQNGYTYGFDEETKSPYVYHAEKKFFASFDDPQSLEEKMKYVKELGLGGMMFWSLNGDSDDGALLNAIDSAR